MQMKLEGTYEEQADFFSELCDVYNEALNEIAELVDDERITNAEAIDSISNVVDSTSVGLVAVIQKYSASLNIYFVDDDEEGPEDGGMLN